METRTPTPACQAPDCAPASPTQVVAADTKDCLHFIEMQRYVVMAGYVSAPRVVGVESKEDLKSRGVRGNRIERKELERNAEKLNRSPVVP